MAYADALRTAQATLTDAATLIDQLLVDVSEAQTSGLISTTSTSLTDVTTLNFTPTLAAGERIILIANVTCSHGTVGAKINLRLLRDSTGLGVFSVVQAHTSATDGEGLAASLHYTEVPGAGAYTYKLQWSVSSGTGYMTSRRMTGFIVRSS